MKTLLKQIFGIYRSKPFTVVRPFKKDQDGNELPLKTGAQTEKVSLANAQSGGAALEYIMVTTFAAIIGIAALGYTGKAIKEQLKRLGQQMGITEEPEINLPFTGTEN